MLLWNYLILLNTVFSSYNIAVIWLMQLDVFYAWRYIPPDVFGQAQGEHFWRLFITVFPQAIAALVLAILLLRNRIAAIPPNPLRLGVALQILTWVLTAILWGRWQGQLALPVTSTTHALGPANWELYETLLHTHWIRVGLITGYWALALWLAAKTISISKQIYRYD